MTLLKNPFLPFLCHVILAKPCLQPVVSWGKIIRLALLLVPWMHCGRAIQLCALEWDDRPWLFPLNTSAWEKPMCRVPNSPTGQVLEAGPGSSVVVDVNDWA